MNAQFVSRSVMGLAIGLSVVMATDSHAATSFNDDVSVWDSDYAPTGPGSQFPIGGSGQVNGDFVVETTDPVQLGLRFSERFVGVPTSLMNTGSEYFAPAGLEWSFDWHIDFGGHTDTDTSSGLSGIPGIGKSLGDYSEAILTMDFDPAPGTTSGDVFHLTPSPFGLGLLPDTTLFQQSWTPTFGFLAGPGFDFNALGVYEFELTLLPRDAASSGDATIVGHSISATLTIVPVVPVPAAAWLGLAGLAMLAVVKRRAILA